MIELQQLVNQQQMNGKHFDHKLIITVMAKVSGIRRFSIFVIVIVNWMCFG